MLYPGPLEGHTSSVCMCAGPGAVYVGGGAKYQKKRRAYEKRFLTSGQRGHSRRGRGLSTAIKQGHWTFFGKET